jgi:hypothetical protein
VLGAGLTPGPVPHRTRPHDLIPAAHRDKAGPVSDFTRCHKHMATDLQINCPEHGTRTAAAVCGHLVHSCKVPLGFIENSNDPNDLQGWCFACEYLFLQEEDKTERFRAFCHHTIVCSACYADLKQFHNFPDSGGG